MRDFPCAGRGLAGYSRRRRGDSMRRGLKEYAHQQRDRPGGCSGGYNRSPCNHPLPAAGERPRQEPRHGGGMGPSSLKGVVPCLDRQTARRAMSAAKTSAKALRNTPPAAYAKPCSASHASRRTASRLIPARLADRVRPTGPSGGNNYTRQFQASSASAGVSRRGPMA